MQKENQKPTTVIYINSENMGQGEDELGQLLMGTFLSTLGEFVNSVSHILLVNSGVKIACEGSDQLELMKEFSENGIEILSCGTCLNFFKLQDKIRAGAKSNMFTIMETMMRAEKIISP